MAGILDSLFGDLQGTSAGGLLGMLGGGGGIGTATRRLRTPEEEQQAALAGYTPTDYTPAPPDYPAGAKGDYLGVTPPPPLGPAINVPSLQVAGAPNGPYAQYSPTSTPTAPLPQQGAAGMGGGQNPLMGLLGGIGNGLSNLLGPSAANAQAAPGAAQQPGIPAPAAAGPGIGDRLGSAWQGLGQGGLTSMVGGLITGQRQDPQGLLERALVQRGVSPDEARAAVKNPQLLPTVLAEQGQGATAQAFEQALLAKGASPQQARALAQAAKYDPDVRKALSTTLYQAPSLVDAGTNPLTGERYHQVYNPNNLTLTNLGANAQGAGGASQILTPANAVALGLPPMSNNQLAQIQALNQEGLPPDEYAAKLKAISPAYSAKATSISKGDLPYPSGPMMKTPYGQLLTDSVSSIKPGVTAQDYGSKQKARNYITSGPGGQEIKAANTFIYHADKMMDQSELMGGFDTLPAVLNPAFQGLKNQFPQLDPKYQTARKKWDELSEIAATEVAKALNGGTPHVADKEHWRQIFAAADGPIQRKAAISGAMEAIDGRMDAASKFYEQSMGETKDPISFIDPANKAKYAKVKGMPVSEITGGGQGTAGQQQGAPSQLRPIDKAAIDWANANPKDPRAAKIKQRLGVQ